MNESEIVENLLASDEQFRSLHRAHHDLDERVKDAEFGTRPINHDSLGSLKNQKLRAKDAMAAMIADYKRLHS